MADNPNQIDISLSLLGADSPAVLTSLSQVLKDISTTMSGLRTEIGGQMMLPGMEGLLPTSGGIYTSRPPEAPAPMEQPSLASEAPDAEPTTRDLPYAQRKVAQYRETHPRGSQPGVTLDGDQYQIADVISPVEKQASYYERVGQFLSNPIRDFSTAFSDDKGALIGGMATSMLDTSKQVVGNVWNGLRGVTPGSENNPNMFAQVKNLGINLAGAPWVLQNMMKVLPSNLPVLGDPRALTQMGGATGRDTMGTQIGPFSIPYSSDAQQFAIGQTVKSFVQGLATPGVSAKDIANVKANLSALGWGTNSADLEHMTKALIPIIQHEKGLDVGTTAAMQDKSMRWGGHSLNEFTTAIRALAPAARAARMSIGEFQKAVSDAGSIAASEGADYLRGIKQATQFSQMTGLPPQLYGQFLQSPWVQANLMSTTGALPWEQGLIDPGTVMGAGLDSANLLTKTFMNMRPKGLSYRDRAGRMVHLSSFQTGTAGAANILGMSPQELRKLEMNKQYLPARTRAWDDISHYAQDVRHGSNSHDAWMKIQRDVFAGHYIDRQHGGNKAMAQKLTNIYNSTANPKKRADAVHKMLEDVMAKAPGASADNKGVVISLAGDAARYFRMQGDKVKVTRWANSGSATGKNTVGMPGSPSPGTFDPYALPNPGDTQASNAFSTPTP